MINRRAFLKAGGVALFTMGAGPSFLDLWSSDAQWCY